MRHNHAAKIIEVFDPPFRSCPYCGALAICMLPPILLSKQPDATNAVCHPAHGGCNQGFELENATKVAGMP